MTDSDPSKTPATNGGPQGRSSVDGFVRRLARVTLSDTEDPRESPMITSVTLSSGLSHYAAILRKAADHLESGQPLEIQVRTKREDIEGGDPMSLWNICPPDEDPPNAERRDGATE